MIELNQLLSILDNRSEALVFFDCKGQTIYFNSAYCSFIKTTFDASIKQGDNIYDILPAPYRLSLKKLQKKALKGQRQVFEFNPNTTNSISLFETTVEPVLNNDQIIGLSAIVKDISDGNETPRKIYDNCLHQEKLSENKVIYALTSNSILAKEIAERKLAEKSLQESKERLCQIIQGNTIPTFVIDQTRTITHWNKACENLTGFSSQEMIGTKNQWKAFYVEKRPTIADLVVKKAKKETIRRYYGNKFRKSSLLDDAYEAEDFFDIGGNSKWLFFTAAPIKNSRGKVIGAIETLQDITVRKSMEEKIRKHQTILEQRIEERTEQLKITYDQLLHAEKLSAVGKLAASIAHEFGNPIIGIRIFLKGLKKSSSIDPTDIETIDLAIRECQRVKDLISNLQNFNRPTSGIISRLNLHKSIDDMLLFCKKNLKEKKIKIIKQYLVNLPKIEAVQDQIKQVILNCLNNAAEAIHQSHGAITIITELKEDKVMLHISDTGKGIKPDEIDHIFEPFFSTKPAVEGTGLGLSVSYGIIKRHNGTIKVSKTSDKGTTFTITLPTKLHAEI